MNTESTKAAKYVIATITVFIIYLIGWFCVGVLLRNMVESGALEKFF